MNKKDADEKAAGDGENSDQIILEQFQEDQPQELQKEEEEPEDENPFTADAALRNANPKEKPKSKWQKINEAKQKVK